MTYRSLLLRSATDLTKNIWEINETISQIFCFISQLVLTIPQLVFADSRRGGRKCLEEFHNRDAGTTKLDMLVVEARYARGSAEVLAHYLA